MIGPLINRNNESRSSSRTLVLLLGIALAWMLGACTSGPPVRLEAYLGPAVEHPVAESDNPLTIPAQGLNAGLVVINDTTAPESAPALSEDTVARLAQVLQQRLEGSFPVTIIKILVDSGISPTGDPAPFSQLARHHDFPYLWVGIFSSNESEVPTYLPLMGILPGAAGGPVNVPGYRADNYARVELALLDGQGRVLIRSEGNAYAELFRLNVPVKSNAYPVVRHSLSFNPIFPDTEANAHDVMRGVATDDGMKNAFIQLKTTWQEVTSQEKLSQAKEHETPQ